MPATVKGRAVKVLHLDLRRLQTLKACDDGIRIAAAAGFNHVCVGPVFDIGSGDDALLVADHHKSIGSLRSIGTPRDLIKALRQSCEKAGVALFVDIVLGRIALDGRSAKSLAGTYAAPPGHNPLDPRLDRRGASSALLRSGAEEVAAAWWAKLLAELVTAGAQGFRLLGLADLPANGLRPILDRVRAGTACAFWGWTPGLPWSRHHELAGVGLSAVFASTCWWDGKSAWFVEEHESLRRIAPVLGVAAIPFEADTGAAMSKASRALTVAAVTADGLFVPKARADADELRTAAALVDRMVGQTDKGGGGGLRSLTSPTDTVTMLLRTDGDRRKAIALNTYPHLSTQHWYDAAVHAVAPVMIGVALLIHNAASARYSTAIVRASAEIPADEADNLLSAPSMGNPAAT